MAKRLLQQTAINLRGQGKSYSEIRKLVRVSKSTLSLWLKDIPLEEYQIEKLRENRLKARERYVISMRKRRETKLRDYYNTQRTKWLPLSKREELLAGLFLYWGEGNKVSSNSISISNTDPSVIRFSIAWMQKCLKIPKGKIFIKLHLYRDMDVGLETKFWSKELGVDIKQFKRPYIKESLSSNLSQRGFGHGTCGVWAFKTVIKENILMAIKAISDWYKINPN